MSPLDTALGLLPSVIKSGESWTSTCEDVLTAARAELTELRQKAADADGGWAEVRRIAAREAVDQHTALEKIEYVGKDIPSFCPYPTRGKTGAPYAYDVDPGAGSAMNRLQRDWPNLTQIDDLRLRGGSVTPLFPVMRKKT